MPDSEKTLPEVATILALKANTFAVLRNFNVAADLSQEALEIFSNVKIKNMDGKSKKGYELALRTSAIASRLKGENEKARKLYQKSYSMAVKNMNLHGEALTILGLAILAREEEKYLYITSLW